MVVILYTILLIGFILLYSLIIGLWPVCFLCGFLLACKYSMHYLMLHDDMGHTGKDRTLSLLRDRFYWPGMYKDTESWIEQYGRCLRRKTPTNQRAPLVPIVTSSPSVS
jgi:hypothetical protein